MGLHYGIPGFRFRVQGLKGSCKDYVVLVLLPVPLPEWGGNESQYDSRVLRNCRDD